MTTTISGGTYILGNFLLTHEEPSPTALSAIVIPIGIQGYGAPYTSGAILSVNGGVDFVSADGNTLPASDGVDVFYGPISVVDGLFYLNRQSGSYAMYTSTDGNVWNVYGGAFGRSEPRTVVAGNSTIVATLYRTASAAATSTNQGATWTTRTLPNSLDWRTLAHGDGNFVGTGGSSNIAVRSSDGINWSNVSIRSTSATFSGVAYGNGTWLAISTGGNVVASTDSTTWADVANIAANFYGGLVYGNGRFVAYYSGGIATSSDNGVNWTITSSPSVSYRGLAYGNGAFWLTTSTNGLVSTTDGVTQTLLGEYIVGTDNPFSGIAVS